MLYVSFNHFLLKVLNDILFPRVKQTVKKVGIILTITKKEDILKVIGKKIQDARKNKNYTQEYVAEKIDKSVDILRSIENGRSIGSVETLLNICNVLDITLDYMFYDLLNKKSEILDNKIYKNFQELNLKEKELIDIIIEHIKKNR